MLAEETFLKLEKKESKSFKNLKNHIFQFHILHFLTLRELLQLLKISKKISNEVKNYGPMSSFIKLYKAAFTNNVKIYFHSNGQFYNDLLKKFPEIQNEYVEEITDLFYTLKLNKVRELDIKEVQARVSDFRRLQRTFPLLSDRTKLLKIDLSGNRFAQDTLESMLVSISEKTQLEVLCLNKTNIGGICYIVRNFLFRSKTIKELHLEQNMIAKVDVRCLFEGLQFNHSLTTLNLAKNTIGLGSSETIAHFLKTQNKNLRSLNLSRNEIKTNGFREISKALSDNLILKELLLESCMIEFSSEKEAIEKVLSTMESLDLSGNYLFPPCLDLLTKSLKSNKNIKNLCLGSLRNLVKGDNFEKLLEGLLVNDCVEKLSFNDNKLSNSMITSLSKYIYNSRSLKYLNISECGLTGERFSELVASLETNKVIEKINIGKIKKENGELKDIVSVYERINLIEFCL